MGSRRQIASKWQANPASSGSPATEVITIVLSSLIEVPVEDQLLLPVASVSSSTIMNLACCSPAGVPPPATNSTSTPAATRRVATVSPVCCPASIATRTVTPRARARSTASSSALTLNV